MSRSLWNPFLLNLIMSSQTFKSKQSNVGSPGSLELEDYLQKIVNSLTLGFEHLKESDSTFKKFAEIFEKSSTLEDIIKAISDLTELLVKCMQRKRVSAESIIRVKSNPASPAKEKSEKSVLDSQANYDSLEKLLQKYEAEIRDHIRIEQQLKIYSESLEERISEFENAKLDLDSKLEKLQGENSKLSKEVVTLKLENQNFERRVKQLRAKDLGSSQPRHSKSNSIESVT